MTHLFVTLAMNTVTYTHSPDLENSSFDVNLYLRYETEPAYVQDQPKFLNAVCEIQTEISPSDVLTRLKLIEKSIGRTPGPRNGPRSMDLDILCIYNAVLFCVI